MLKYKCLVLDHDDTVVQSEVTVNYPCFLLALEKFRPGETMGYEEFVDWCFRYDFGDFLKVKYKFTDEELREEYLMWLEYSKTHIPPVYSGIKELILEQKKCGGLVCVVSLSGTQNITRDYDLHIGIQPDMLFSCDAPREQRKPSAYPIQTIMHAFGLKEEDILVVDDLKIGYEMAKNAGVKMAFAGWGRQASPALCAEMAKLCDHSFHNVANLHKFLFEV